MALQPSSSSESAASRDHPWRAALSGEVHARPYPEVAAPGRISHVACLSGEAAAEDERRHVAGLCQRHGVAPPAPGVIHFSHDFGGFRLRWERHTEFSTYTFFVAGRFETPFAEPAIERVPADWLAGLVGERLVAVHLALQERGVAADIPRLFAGNPVAGGGVVGGRATLYTDFHIHGDGFGRILVEDAGLTSEQAGRLVQRLLEIETYRMMALLALPPARQYGPRVSDIEDRLTQLVARMAELDELEDERATLDELSRLAADLERIVAENSYRFGAAQAYYALVERRIEKLREVRVEGRQPIAEYLDRRLAPAMRTCASLAQRQEVLSGRVARASDMLRTRVNLKLERQNRDLLASMDRRARLQFRLQQTVEWLSVVAVSYYATGLVAYGLKALKAAGARVNVDVAVGLSIPVVVIAVLLAVRWLKRVFVKP